MRHAASAIRSQESEERRLSVPRPSSLVPRPARSVPRHSALSPRPAFTLVELLVAISILLILATITFTMVNSTMKGDQIRSAARQVQSYLEGARDRAIHAKEPRGVRFLLDPVNTNTVTSMVFIGAPGTYKTGQFQIGDGAGDNRSITLLNGQPWTEMSERGLISNGQPIEIADNFYTIVYQEFPAGSGTFRWRLTRDFTGSGAGPWTIDGTASNGYTLQLNPAVLPNQEPRILPKGIVIDLPHSRLPPFWGSAGAYSTQMDVLFSPRGTVTGLVSSAGNIHLLLADIRDVERGLGALDVDLNANSTLDENEKNLGDKLLVTITTQTGKVSSHPIYYDLVSGMTDVYRYAELGEEVK